MNRLSIFRSLTSTILIALLWAVASTALGQENLITNGQFETNGGYTSQYTRTYGANVVEAGHYAIDNTTANHGGGGGWPTLTGSTGRFMLVNGLGGNNNPTTTVWTTQQPLTVTANTPYTFSCKVANLNIAYQGQIYPAKLQLKINGESVGSVNQLPNNNDWHTWEVHWPGGNTTQAVIQIVDMYTGNSGVGDDYALDDMSFVPDVVYSVTANNDYVTVCQNILENIYVLDNDIIQPNIQGVTLNVVTNPQYGQCFIDNTNHCIQYVYTGGGNGTDQFKYRVTNNGITGEAWVYITTNTPPTVSNISAPGPICAGGVLGINVPSVTPSGATGQWEKSTTQSGTFQSFDPNNIPLSMNGNWVRYTATNDCGSGSSNAVQITVTNGPNFTGQTPQLQAICAGGNLSLTPPAFNSNGSQILSQGWVASPTENGEYTTFNNNSLNNIPASYNGWYIRYMVEGSCGYVYSNPARLLTVNVAPCNVSTLEAPYAICAGDDLDVTVPTYDGTGTGTWEICQTQNGTYQSFNINNVPATYNNWYLHYKVSNTCGSVTSNAVQIHVNEAPTIATPATPSAICAGGSFSLSTPSIQNHGATVTDQGWQIAATQNGTYNSFSNNNVQYSMNGYWLRYYAVNECGEAHSASVQVTVNDEPIVGNIAVPAGICAGESFNLTTPQVTWRHNNMSTCTGNWEIAPTSSGDFVALNNNNIPYAYNGYYLRYKAMNGCGTAYSSNVVQVTVYSTEPTYDTLTACDTYVWNGVTCNQTGNYQAQVQNPNGCTITAHLHFIMSDAYTETQTISHCNAYTWPRNGQTYNTSGTYEYMVESGNPLVCDSIFTLLLTINSNPEITSNITAPAAACAGSALGVVAPQYEMNHTEGGDAHWEYATSASGPFTPFDPSANALDYGTYYLRYAVVNSCGQEVSNVVTFHINDVPVAHTQLGAMQVCEGELLQLPEVNVEWRNDNENDRIAQWQMSPTPNGTFAPIDPTMPIQLDHNGYWLRFMAQNGCGSDVVGPVMITVLSVENQWLETITACDAYVLESGQVVTESTTIEYEVFEPCYHLVYQPVVINYSNNVVEPITSCHDEFEWHGMTFYRSDQTQYASVSLTNVYGCDSVVELQLDFGDYAKVTEQYTACDYYEWPRKPGSHYTTSQVDSLFIEGSDMVCDSMIYLSLTVGQTYELEGDPMTECSGFVWNGVAYYEDAVLYDSLYTVGTHCDSIISYRLTVIPPIEEETSMTSCRPVWWNGYYFEEDGDQYTYTYTSQQGCDSIVTMHFSLAAEIVQQVDTTVCGPFSWYGNYFSENGDSFSYTFLTAEGCDSTVVMRAIMGEAQVEEVSITACDSITVGGIAYIQPGDYTLYYDTIYSQGGCDSIIHHATISIRSSEQMGTIDGSHEVYVSSNLITGVYRYDIDTEGILGTVEWSLSNPEWSVVEVANGYCRILVPTSGYATLTARFETATCGIMERQFVIHAGFFSVDENGVEVSIYPNPTKGTVTIEAEGIKSVRLVNMMGQTLDWVETDLADHVTLNLNHLAPSIYLLEIETVNGMVKRRVVLCR